MHSKQTEKLISLRKQLVIQYNHGAALSALSKLHKISSMTVRSMLVEEGAIQNVDDLQDKTFRKELVSAYSGGSPLMTLSRKYGISMGMVRNILVEEGVTIRKKGRTILSGPRLEDEQRASEMDALYKEGQTLAKIGDQYGVTRERVRQILKAYGTTSLGHRSSTFLSPKEKEIAEAYELGVSPSALRKKYTDLSYANLHVILKKAGVPLKPRGFFIRRQNYDVVMNGVVSDYQNGIDTVLIAEKHGLSCSTEIYKMLKRAGVDPSRRTATV